MTKLAKVRKQTSEKAGSLNACLTGERLLLNVEQLALWSVGYS
jgi:hypothetical protein